MIHNLVDQTISMQKAKKLHDALHSGSMNSGFFWLIHLKYNGQNDFGQYDSYPFQNPTRSFTKPNLVILHLDFNWLVFWTCGFQCCLRA